MLNNADNAYGFKKPYMYGDSSDDQEDLYGLKKDTKPMQLQDRKKAKDDQQNEDDALSNDSNLSNSKKLGIS